VLQLGPDAAVQARVQAFHCPGVQLVADLDEIGDRKEDVGSLRADGVPAWTLLHPIN
jgi:hypothetical protein